MGEMKVEHVLLFLVGAFLVYHMMGKCGRVEGLDTKIKDCSFNLAASCPDYDKKLCHWDGISYQIEEDKVIYNYYPAYQRCSTRHPNGTIELGFSEWPSSHWPTPTLPACAPPKQAPEDTDD